MIWSLSESHLCVEKAFTGAILASGSGAYMGKGRMSMAFEQKLLFGHGFMKQFSLLSGCMLSFGISIRIYRLSR